MCDLEDMNNTNTSPLSPSTSHRGAFRLNYTDIYPQKTMSDESDKELLLLEMVCPTPELPILADIGCKIVILTSTLECLEGMGVDPMKSNVGIQGWVERYCRRAGLAHTPVPSGKLGLYLLRAKCFWSGIRSIAEDVFPKR